MARINSSYQRLCFRFNCGNKSGNAHTTEMCIIMHWPLCNSNNSPGKFNTITGEAVGHSEAAASSRVQALWNSWEHTKLTCAGTAAASPSSLIPMPIYKTRRDVCPSTNFTGVCWFVLLEPPAATLKHGVAKGQNLATLWQLHRPA